MAAKRKPEPRVVSEVCSLCGLDWKLHGKEPTTETCIDLLLAEVRSLNAQLAVRPVLRPLPYPVPYPVPYTPPWRPWQPTPYWGGTTQITYGGSTGVQTPRLSTGTPMPVLAGTATRGLSS